MTSPYSNLSDKAYWRSGVVETDKTLWPDVFSPKFKISDKTAIATAGSCFAQHIGRRLKGQGMTVLDAEPAPAGLSEEDAKRLSYGIYSARYGNIYTPRQLRELLDDVAQDRVHEDLFWQKENRFFDALRPGVKPDGFDSLSVAMDQRRAHLACVRRLLIDTDIFVFTLGLTEAWMDDKVGRVMALAPGVIAGEYDPARYRFHNFAFDELVDDLEAIYTALTAVNPDMKLLLTVSPVPLTATASNEHVLAATTYSKAVLRAAAGEMTNENSAVDYFPSYELVTTWAQDIPAFEANLRSVTPQMVDRVMSVFMGAHNIT
ncbi:GSCFA domain-containing protein [Pacificibacter marinus]|uniref:GSCFA domain-containing protein n=1 Tax=Pacificibacter marinus TaxID=658057 RepID=UPI00339D4127